MLGGNGLEECCFADTVFAHESVPSLVGKAQFSAVQKLFAIVEGERHVADLHVAFSPVGCVIGQDHGRHGTRVVAAFLGLLPLEFGLVLPPGLFQFLTSLATILGGRRLLMSIDNGVGHGMDLVPVGTPQKAIGIVFGGRGGFQRRTHIDQTLL